MYRSDDNKKHHHRHGDKCVTQETVIKNVRLAMAYVPFQYFCKLFSPVESLKFGTVFPELYSPYDGKSKRKCPCDPK